VSPALLILTEAEEVEKLRAEEEEGNRQLRSFNLKLQNRLVRVELENVDLKKHIQQTQEKLSNIERLIQEVEERGSRILSF
jgi:hypothetical protein